jgi:hypothetical protein
LVCALVVGCNSRYRGGGGPFPDAGPPGTCGDGTRSSGEVCDGADVGESTCETFRFTGGTLRCDASCQDYDFSMCEGEAGECGNGTAEPGELCDGSDLGGASCESVGFGGGTLGCATGCRAYDTSGCGEAPMGSPRILTFTTNVTTITEGESVTFSLVATDPDGVDDIIGGTLNDPGSTLSYGTLATAATEGAYTITLSWSEIHRVRAIDFTAPMARMFEAEIFDVAGNRAVDLVSVTLSCGTDAACDGSCTFLGDDYNCGACDNFCEGGTYCTEGTTGYACDCPTGESFCGGSSCTPLDTETDCGACGVTCLSGSYCEPDGSGYSCQCFGANEDYCPGLGCVDITTPMNCGACGAACGTGEFCRSTGGTYACAMGYDMMAPTQTIAFTGGTNTFTFSGVPMVSSGTPAVVTIYASGDFDTSSVEYATIAVDSTTVGTFTVGSCIGTTRMFNVTDISSAASDGIVRVTFRTTADVHAGGCSSVSDTVYARLTF